MDDTIGGWISYRFHPPIIVSKGINRQFFQYKDFSNTVIQSKLGPVFTSSCSGCGARDRVNLNGKTVYSYCRGELNG